jgi:hypothetical protein
MMTQNELRGMLAHYLALGGSRDFSFGVVHGLLWALTGERPPFDCALTEPVLKAAGIPYRVEGDTVIFPLPGEPDWPWPEGG